jgi:hypothetical protein
MIRNASAGGRGGDDFSTVAGHLRARTRDRARAGAARHTEEGTS